MHTILATLQVLLLLPMLPLALMSRRTSRSQRGRHQGFMAVAAGVGTVSFLLVLLGLSAAAEEAPDDLLLAYGLPLLTVTLCALVLRRGLSRPPRSRSVPKTR